MICHDLQQNNSIYKWVVKIIVIIALNSTKNIGTHKCENKQNHYSSKNTLFQCVIVSIFHLQKCIEEHIMFTKYSCSNY